MYLVYNGLFDKIRRLYFRKILKRYRISQTARFLDYGCGPGDMLLTCQQLGIQAHGIDAAQWSVDIAKKRGLQVDLGDYRRMPYEKGFFDVIFLQSVVEHVHDPVELLMQLREYLQPKGLLIISCPTPGPHFWDDPTHIRPHTPKSFASLAELCSYNVIEITYVFAFLLGINLRNSLFYKLLNVLPFTLGSNIIGVFAKHG